MKKNFEKSFGGLKKVPIFATPIEKEEGKKFLKRLAKEVER